MRTKKDESSIVLTKSIGAISVIFLLLSLSGCITDSSQKPVSIADQQAHINNLLENADTQFWILINTEQQTDSEGNPYLVGVLDPELDASLNEMTGAYNADPSTTRPITEQELRASLTEGLVEASEEDAKNSALYDFLCWTDAPAELVYKDNYSDANGNIVQKEGDEVVGSGHTNYTFTTHREGNANYKYAWE